MFGLLYTLFAVQFAYSAVQAVIIGAPGFSDLMVFSVVWLALMAARYFSKKSAGLGKSNDNGGGYRGGRRY